MGSVAWEMGNLRVAQLLLGGGEALRLVQFRAWKIRGAEWLIVVMLSFG